MEASNAFTMIKFSASTIETTSVIDESTSKAYSKVTSLNIYLVFICKDKVSK